jgi:hypothetical protein
MKRYEKIWEDMTRYDKIWEDMTRYDKIWQDMTRYDTWSVPHAISNLKTESVVKLDLKKWKIIDYMSHTNLGKTRVIFLIDLGMNSSLRSPAILIFWL